MDTFLYVQLPSPNLLGVINSIPWKIPLKWYMVYGPMVHHSHYRKIWHFPCVVKVSLGSGFCVWVIPSGTAAFYSIGSHWWKKLLIPLPGKVHMLQRSCILPGLMMFQYNQCGVDRRMIDLLRENFSLQYQYNIN